MNTEGFDNLYRISEILKNCFEFVEYIENIRF